MTVSDDMVIQDQSLKDFLNKPQLLYSSEWETTDLDNTMLYNFDINAAIEANPYWTNKIQGYALYRGTAVITLIMNANPFQQGKLLLHFLPYSGTSGLNYAMHSANKAAKRMQPCVELDCRDSGAVMKIPYINTTNFYNRVNAGGHWGGVSLSVFAPLKTGASGETKVGYSIYMHFEDFEFAAPIVPQSHASSKRYSAKTVSREHSVLSGGQVSKGLGLAAQVADSISVVPSLAPLTKPAAWVFRGFEALASHFGWSKTNMEEIPLPVVRTMNRFAAVSDGTDSAIPLALINTNRTTVSCANSLTDEDEMSFEYLKRISTVYKTITWSATDIAGDQLLSQEIDPFQFKEVSTKLVAGKTMTYGIGPPIYYLSNCFASYRGSIKLTIKLAKTEFHSGRLQIVYIPLRTGDIAVTPTTTNSTLALREIIDIRNGNEFTLHIPYLYQTNYVQTGTVMGNLYITVLNELRCPETSAQEIDILLYASGGDDFEYQGFCNTGLVSFTGQTFQNFTRVFSPQMDIKEVIDKPIGNSKVVSKSMDYAQQSFGEYFASVKQLLLRQSPVNFRTTSVATSTEQVGFYPFTCGVITMNNTTGVIESPNIGGDVFSFIANMYAFYRGGMSVQVLPANVGDVSAALYRVNFDTTQLELVPITFGYRGANAWNNLTARTMTNGVYTNDSAQATTVVEVPYYCTHKCSPVVNAPASDSKCVYAGTPSHGVCFGSSSASTFGSYGIRRAVRDDFQFSYFVGCPPIALSYV